MPDLRKTLALLALLLGACGEGASIENAPLDRFTYPTGLALQTLGDGSRALVVVSSNFDLRYDTADGGSVMVVDPDASSGDALAVRSVLRIPSLAGPLAVLTGRDDPATAAVDPTCAQWTGGDQVLVASRSASALLRIALGDDGSLACGEGCRVDIPQDLIDPYAVAVACRSSAGAPVAEAYVTHLGTTTGEGWLSRVDLLAASPTPARLSLASTPSQDLAWDAARAMLYVTSRFYIVGYAPLRWLDLAFPSGAIGASDLNSSLRGTDTRGIALADPAPGTGFARRAYVAARIYDQDLSATYGGRTADVAGALMVLDLTNDVAGRPTAQVTAVVPVGIGASRVAVLPGRPAGEEIVAITSDEGSVALYDARRGALVRVLATASADTIAPGPFQPLEVEDPAAAPGPRDAAAYHAGERLFGSQPFALAAERLADGRVRLFVSSFDRGFVAEVLIDPALPAAAQVTKRFGRRHD